MNKSKDFIFTRNDDNPRNEKKLPRKDVVLEGWEEANLVFKNVPQVNLNTNT